MITAALLQFIKDQISQGINTGEIKTTLLAQGWKEEDINQGFTQVGQPTEAPVIGTLGVMSTSLPTTPDPKPSKRPILGKLIKIIVIVVLLLVASGGGVWAYFNFIDNPQAKIIQSLEKMEKITSFAYTAEVKLQVNASDLLKIPNIQTKNILPADTNVLGTQSVMLKIDLSGKADVKDPNNSKQEFNVKVSNQQLFPTGDLKLDAVIIDKDAYFKIGALPILQTLGFDFLANQWVKIDTKDLNKTLGVDRPEESKLEQIQNKKLEEAFKKHKVIKKITKDKDELINDVSTNHYKVVVDKEELKELLKEDYGQINLPKSEIDQAISFLNQTEIPDIELWVGKNDGMLYQVLASVKINDSSNYAGSADILFSFKDYNKPQEIKPPESFKTFEQLMLDYQTKIMNNSTLFNNY